MLNIKPTTLKNWSRAYSTYLSESAAPKKAGLHRSYSLDDIRVLATVVELTGQGMSHDEAITSIANGTRAELPPTHADYSLVINSKDQLMLLQAHVRDLEAQVEILKGERDKRLQLEALLKQREDDLERARKEIRQLYREVAQLESKSGD